MKTYKYKTIDILGLNAKGLVLLLNNEGFDGWEFVIILDNRSLILKKEYTDEQ